MRQEQINLQDKMIYNNIIRKLFKINSLCIGTLLT